MGRVRSALIAALAGACQFSPQPAAGGDAGRVDATAGSDAASGSDAGALLHCGDHVVEQGEECDDGNSAAGDGCAACLIEPGWLCPAGLPCKRATGLLLAPAELLASAGSSPGGNAYVHACDPGSAIVGFDGDVSDDGGHFGRIRAQCAQIGFDSAGHASWTTTKPTPYAGTENNQGLGPVTCGSDSVVVGDIATADQFLSALAITCVPLSVAHGALAYGAVTTLAALGPGSGTVGAPTQCAAGEAAADFEGKSGSVIDHFALRCSTLTPIAP